MKAEELPADLTIESVQRTIWLGPYGEEHASEQAALRAHIVKRIEDIASEWSGYDGLDTIGFVDALVKRKDDVIRWLNMLGAPTGTSAQNGRQT